MMLKQTGLALFIDNTLVGYDNDSLIGYDYQKNIMYMLVRDISNLLNSKPIYAIKEGGLEDFILAYGFADLGRYSVYSSEDQEIVGNLIKRCLELFEPRLSNISITPILDQNTYGLIFYFKITATIRLVDEVKEIVLESQIDKESNRISLKLGS